MAQRAWVRRFRTAAPRHVLLSLAWGIAGALTACGGGGGAPTDAAALAPVAPASAPASAAAPARTILGVDAMRLADQAAFGPSPTLVAQIEAQGAGWIDAQLALPATGYAPIAPITATAAVQCPPTAAATCLRDHYSAFPLQLQFYRNAVAGPDQLRQRVALAWSQIFVVSSAELLPAYAMREYQQMLLERAFGNFRDLMEAVTLSPVMGQYLDMVNNGPGDPDGASRPNENFARELLQLFTLGPTLLNADGSPVLRDGVPAPAYSQAEIEGFARLFTGWTYATAGSDGAPAPGWRTDPWYGAPMVPFADGHDGGAKTLLRGATVPAGQTALADLRAGLDNVFAHPNVGPFIGRHLIRFLVTSNPSPAYVARVAAVFDDDGHGARGNLAAVVRSILLDDEARRPAAGDTLHGKLREPAVDVAAVLRALQGQTDGLYPNYVAHLMGQPVFSSPTVFNFYPADYPLPGSPGLVAPQFGILNTASAGARLNFVNAVVHAPDGLVFGPVAGTPGATGTRVDLAAYEALAADVPALVRHLNTTLLRGALGDREIAIVIAAVQAVPSTSPTLQRDRARAALYLALASPHYQISR